MAKLAPSPAPARPVPLVTASRAFWIEKREKLFHVLSAEKRGTELGEPVECCVPGPYEALAYEQLADAVLGHYHREQVRRAKER